MFSEIFLLAFANGKLRPEGIFRRF